ncbi:MAG: hypothetical protein U1E76_25340 [Planctomycetota bacterium]
MRCAINLVTLVAMALVPGHATSFVWWNVAQYPEDLASTRDAWSAVRGEMPDQSYRLAADDFELAQPTRITRIEFWSVEIGTPHILGGDWYIFTGGASGPPGTLLEAGPSQPMQHQDSGIVNPSFGTVYSNVLAPDDLILPAGHYFLALRTYQLVDYSSPTKDTNAALTTRFQNGRSRGWWNFDVLADGSVTGPWVRMSQFNNADNEWCFRIDGEALGAITRVHALR